MNVSWKSCLFVAVMLGVVGSALLAALLYLFVDWARDEDGTRSTHLEEAYRKGHVFRANEPSTCFEETEKRLEACMVVDLECLMRAEHFQEGCLDQMNDLSYCDGIPQDRGEQDAWLEKMCTRTIPSQVIMKCFVFYQSRAKYCQKHRVASEVERCIQSCDSPTTKDCVSRCVNASGGS